VFRGEKGLETAASFNERERAALRYADMLSKTLIRVDKNVIADVKRLFSQEEMVILAVLVGKVNYWGRFSEGLGIPPAGFNSPDDPELKFSEFDSGGK
jgi:alkylhydroperoxidase family enzyme